MASTKSGQVTLRGRFSKGSVVTLTKVADESVQRPQGGEDVETKTVSDKDGATFVQFTKGVEVGARYIVHGINDGFPLQVRARGRAADDDSEVLSQPPVAPDRVRTASGWVDEQPTKESAPKREVAPLPRQSQVPDDQPQRSSTPLGEAHPHDPSEPAPYGRQEDVGDDVVQMSSTETGRAAPLDLGSQKQEDVKAGTWQRSDTPTGVATPIPAGDAIKAAADKESSAAKERRGEPVRAAAEPLAEAGTSGLPAKKEVTDTHPTLSQPGRIDRRGVDAMGQPAYADVSSSTGIDAASKPNSDKEQEPKSSRASKQTGKTATAARTAKKASPPEGDKAANQQSEPNSTSTTAKEK
jgi:hypothetical protein